MPARKLDQVKKMQGTFRPDREKSKKKPRGNRIKQLNVPYWMDSKTKAVYRHLAHTLNDLEILRKQDLIILSKLCKYIADWREAEEIIQLEGKILIDKNNFSRIHPLVRYQRNCMEIIISLSKKFGLTPLDRDGIFIGDDKHENDPIAELIRMMNV